MCFQNEVSFLLPIWVGCPVFQVSQAWDANGQRFDQPFSAYDLPFSALHCTKVSLVVFLKDVLLRFLFRILPYKSDSVEHEAPRWKKSILKSPSRSPAVVPIIWIFGESRCIAVPWASICLGHMIVNTWRREIALPCFQSCRIVMTTHLARCSNMWQLNTWVFPRRIHTSPSFFKPLLSGAHETTLCLRTFSFTVL